MFNLIVSASGWSDSRDSTILSRLFEGTDPEEIERFRPGGELNLNALAALPTLLMTENMSGDDPIARVVTITHAKVMGGDIILEYSDDAAAPKLVNSQLRDVAFDLDIEGFEFTRTHWAVKDVDLYKALYHSFEPRRPKPRVFQIDDPENIQQTLIAVMMPFSQEFDVVYDSLKITASSIQLQCRRADDIWENPTVIQDVVSLIDRARVVICDCTNRNPNVFYEIGIAHALGREVILITQAENDIPFDLRHLRYLKYLNNSEGLEKLREDLKIRLASLVE